VTWLLKLYPPRWRRRYGTEFLALIAPQPFSIGVSIDIIGGAIDAWTQPQAHLARAASHTEGDKDMLAKAMRLRCAGYGAKTTTADGLKSAGVILGGTVLAVLVAAWMKRQPIDPIWAKTLATNGWLIAVIGSERYTTLKGWPGRRQAIFMGAQLTLILLLTFGAAWIKTR